MGFGILFIGYALAIGSTFYGTYFFGDVIGAVIMFFAFLKLRQYERSFVVAADLSAVYAGVSAASAAMALMGYTDESYAVPELIGTRVFGAVQFALPIVLVALYVSMLLSMARLAKSVELPWLSRRAVWTLSLIIMYTVAYLVLYFAGDRIANASLGVYNGYVSVLGLFQVIYYLVVLALILSYLKWVVPAEVAEAEESGVPLEHESLLTRLGGKVDQLEQKVKRRRDDSQSIEDSSADVKKD